MKNIFMRERTRFNINNIFEKETKYHIIRSSDILERKLDELNFLIYTGLDKVKQYIIESFEGISDHSIDVAEIKNLFEEYKITNEWFLNKGIYSIYDITNAINSKYTPKETVKELRDILDTHTTFASEVICKKLTTKRAKKILKYINEVPFYLKNDMTQEMVQETDTISLKERKVIKTNYDRENYNFRQVMNENKGYKLAM